MATGGPPDKTKLYLPNQNSISPIKTLSLHAKLYLSRNSISKLYLSRNSISKLYLSQNSISKLYLSTQNSISPLETLSLQAKLYLSTLFGPRNNQGPLKFIAVHAISGLADKVDTLTTSTSGYSRAQYA